MRVLNVSLDLFVDPISRWAGSGEARLSADVYRAWPPELLRRFLEERCGLNPRSPAPAVFVDEHEGALSVWGEEIERGELIPPFDLVHLDAHSNLGAGDEGWFYVLGQLLHIPADQRPVRADRERIRPENYLLFALAFGWIRTFTFVTHHTWESDVLSILYGGQDPGSGVLQLGRYDPLLLEPALERGDEPPEPLSREARVPFRVLGPGDFQEPGLFDRIVVSRSPRFTPRSADALEETLREILASP